MVCGCFSTWGHTEVSQSGFAPKRCQSASLSDSWDVRSFLDKPSKGKRTALSARWHRAEVAMSPVPKLYKGRGMGAVGT